MGKFTYDQNDNRYQLKGGKHTCPQCGKHTLQLYINVENADPINDIVGKCDRHYNCGYDLKPWAYFEEHPDELPMKCKHRHTKPEPPKPLVPIPIEYVEKSMATAYPDQCDFVDILLRMFSKEDVARVCQQYKLGKTKDNAVIFWQIDENGLVHEGKAMAYNLANGKRDKSSWATGASKWIFSTLQGKGVLPEGVGSIKILFGQHLLKNADCKTKVCITESEKNAIFGALAFPNYTWLAVGSKQEFGKIWKVRKLLAKCSCVIIVPDSDAFNDWRKEAEKLKLTNLKVWNLCQGHADGWDIADYIRDIWLRKPQTLKAYQPTTTTPPPKKKLTPTQRTIVALSPDGLMAKHMWNPAFVQLVNDLDLCEPIDPEEPF